MAGTLETLAERRNQIDENVPSRLRLAGLFDGGSYVELDAYAASGGQSCGVVTGYGYVHGNPVVAYSQDITDESGAVTTAHAKKIKKAYELAVKTGCPVVGIFDSNGAKLSEGVDVLAAYGEIMQEANNLSGVVPQISLVLGTCAGTAAVIACSADIVILSKQAEFYMALPSAEGAQTVEHAAASGAVHLVCEEEQQAIESARSVLNLLPVNNLSQPPMFEGGENAVAVTAQTAGRALIEAIADAGSSIELQPEFAPCVLTALATVGGTVAGLVATNPSYSSEICANGAVKVARFVRMCDAFNIPIITFVDTKGFQTTAGAELAGSIREIAKLAHAYAEATTAKISVVTGEAYGSAYVVFAGKNANADLSLAWESASISALQPETAVELFWHDRLKGVDDLARARAELVQTYQQTEASAFIAAEGGYLDNVIAPAETRNALISALDMLVGKRVSKLPKKHGNMPL